MADGQLGAVLQQLRRLVGARAAADAADAQLLARFGASRDEAAFAALLARHGPLVLNVCRRVLGNVHDAEDAFQAVFLVLARQADSIRRHDSLGSWLYGVAFRIASRAKANAARRDRHERRADVMKPEGADLRDGWDDLQPILDEELSRLPAKYRDSIVLRYLQGKSNEDAAREAGCPAGTMSWRLAHGLDLLRQRLQRRGVAVPAAGLALALTEHAVALSPALSAATVQAAVHFAAGETAGVSLSILVLAQGAVKAMFVTKLKFALAVVLVAGVVGLGVGWLSWHMIGRGTPTALAVPLPEPKAAAPRLLGDKVVSEAVVANEASFRLETSAVWLQPPGGGQRLIPLALGIENQRKTARAFIPWRGSVVLLTAAGAPIKAASHGRDATRRLPDSKVLDYGQELTAAEAVRFSQGPQGASLFWFDSTGSVFSFDNLKAGKYRIALQYTMTNRPADQWSGDVTTNPVEIEIREPVAQAVDGLELTLAADRPTTLLKADASDAEPIKLTLTCTNVSTKPLKLNTYPVETWGHNALRVVGPDGKELSRVATPPAPPAAARPEQFPILQPGASWQYSIRFPTAHYRLNAAGEYRIRTSYVGGEATAPHPSPAFAAGSWTGKLESNEVTLTVKPAK